MQIQRSQLITDIFSTLEQSKRAMHSYLYQYCDQSGISASHIYVLLLINQCQPISLTQLSKRMRITPGAITQTVESLVQDRYIMRKQDENDRRIVYVSVTEKGAKKVADLQKIQLERFTRMVANVDNDELTSYLKVQQKILAQVEEELQTMKQGEQQ